MAVLKDLIEKRAKLIADARTFNDSIKGKSTPEQDSKWASMNAEIDEVGAEIQRAERLARVESETREAAERDKAERAKSTPGLEDVKPGARSGDGEVTDETRSLALAGWLSGGMATSEQRKAAAACGFDLSQPLLDVKPARSRDVRAIQAAHREFRGERLERELRNMSLTGAAGGYSVIPGTLVKQLELNRLAFGGFMNYGETIVTEDGAPLYWPTADDTGNIGAIVAEAATASLATGVDPTFTRLQLDSYKISSTPIRISFELLRDSVFDVPGLIGGMLGERIGRKEGALSATGTGSSQHKGIVPASTLGKTAAATTDITFDELLDLEASIDPAYRANAAWAMKDATALILRKKKDGDGQYIWRDNLQAGAPDMLLGHPVRIIQEMPAATTGLKSVLFGDFSYLKIRRIGGLRLRRLDEIYADTDEVAFIAFASSDCDLLDPATHPVKHLIQA